MVHVVFEWRTLSASEMPMKTPRRTRRTFEFCGVQTAPGNRSMICLSRFAMLVMRLWQTQQSQKSKRRQLPRRNARQRGGCCGSYWAARGL